MSKVKKQKSNSMSATKDAVSADDLSEKIRASFVRKKKIPEKDHILSIRITKATWERLDTRARKDGARSISAWIMAALNAILDTTEKMK
jgi:hypothetical protein